ncbi:aspartate/glutamate racemase family protein [Martelella mediterranea]|uniref:Aspartate racemase n=1 Tax=Martelella mediterranea TaxID=293089 RepID=A0A4R3P2M5_9HYPH|nr:aspartate/glutamate racemase family protein [Martelella mediterranea]TCT44958.1 aspartate racemase [Martelella mediterranea]
MQKTIGLIGGMSWESTAVYYKEINEIVRRRYGGLSSADVLIHSVDFSRIVAWQKAGEWGKAAEYLGDVGKKLQDAGADCTLICTNTMHIIADEVSAHFDIPLIHIVDVTGSALKAAGAKKPLLLATRYTMEQSFYRDRLKAEYGIEAIVPDEADRAGVHNVIFEELCCGVIRKSSHDLYCQAIEKAKASGCDAVILGCTEIGLLIGPDDTDLPVFDSTKLHAAAAVDFACGVDDNQLLATG